MAMTKEELDAGVETSSVERNTRHGRPVRLSEAQIPKPALFIPVILTRLWNATGA